MDPGVMLAVFTSVFMAELGDKTQVATVCFMAGGKCSRLEVFMASSAALILSTLLAVIFGAAIGRFVPTSFLQIGAGIIFVVMGVLFLRQGLFPSPEGQGEGGQ